MNIRLHRMAATDFEEAYQFYERQRPGLGAEFAQAIDAAIEKVLESPNRWANHMLGTKLYPVKRFPYGIVYRRLSADDVVVYAVMHLHRRPAYWARRLNT